MSRNLFRSTVGVLTGRLTLPVFSFLLFFVTARLLTVADFGVYVLLNGLATLFQGMATLGLGQLLSREIGKRPEEEGLAVGSAVAIILPASAAAYALFLAIAYLLKGEGEFLLLAAIMGLSLPLSGLIAVAESVFMARGTGGNLFRLGLLEQTVRVALSVGALLAGYGLYGLTAAYAASRVLGLIGAGYLYALPLSRPALRQGIRVDRAHVRRTCGQLRAFAPIMILGLVLYRADVLTLGWFLTDEEMGLYGCAVRVVNLAFVGPDSVVAATFPEVSRRWSEGAEDFGGRMRGILNFLLAASLFGTFLMAAAAPLAVPLVFGVKFLPAAPLLAVLAFMLPAHAVELQAETLLQAIGRERTAVLLMLCSVPVFCGFLAAGAGWGGLFGACAGFVAAPWLMGIAGLRILPAAALERSRGAECARAIGLTVAPAALVVSMHPGTDAVFCLLLAAVALTALCGSGIVTALRMRTIRSVLS